MQARRNSGFTLVEILIVVVILGILAAIVVPQFTSASQEAIKGALSSQLQTINSQIELYRVRNQGAYPHEGIADFGGAAANDGWGDMVGSDYLKEVPMNGFTSAGVVVASATAQADALAQDRDSANGWYYSTADDLTVGTVYAAGFDPDTNTLNGEDGYPAGG